ncbi:MAG: hypothetical protein V7L05_13190 [Nostoc sp.]|uniref:hypothetical protein n=1 Tax=Nostoc sp. TaxID=1180 RepID=UPI002FF74CAF
MLRNYLGTPTIDERCGVILEFEYACPDKFAQLVTDAPQWTEFTPDERELIMNLSQVYQSVLSLDFNP